MGLPKPKVLEPYQVWMYTVPNEHPYDTTPPKFRPIIIIDPLYFEEEIEDGTLDQDDLDTIYPIFVHGTSNVSRYAFEEDCYIVNYLDAKRIHLNKDTAFRFSQSFYRQTESVNDIFNNGEFLGYMPKDLQKDLYDFVQKHVKHIKMQPPLNESLEESLSNCDSLGNKLSQEQVDFFKNSKVRDEKGNLLVCYHGTKENNFDVFKYSKNKQTGTNFGKAYYFTTNRTNAKGYAKDTSKDPRFIEYDKKHNEIIDNFLIAVKSNNKEDMEKWKNELKNLKVDNMTLDDIIKDVNYDTGGTIKEVYLNLINPLIVDAEGELYYKVYPEYFEQAHKNNNDGIIIYNVDDSSKPNVGLSDVYIVFNENAIKNITNVNPTTSLNINEDVETNEVDSMGNTLLKDQVEYFKNSKIRNSNGDLLVCYHGTINPGFDEFSPQKANSQFGDYKFKNANVNYFTTSLDVARGYTEIGVGDVDKEYKNIYACYLNITNPYVVDNSTKAEIKSWNNIKDKNIRQIQLDEFNKFYKKWDNELFYTDKEEQEDFLEDINEELFYFGFALEPSDYDEDDEDYKNDLVVDLWKLANNTLYGGKQVVMKQYKLVDLFDDSEYGETFKENIIGYAEDLDDYYYQIDDIIKWVLLTNSKGETNYDGIIIKDIKDVGPKGSVFMTEQGTDIVTLISPNQIKSISNKQPTTSNKLNEDFEETDSVGNSLSPNQVEFFKDSEVVDAEGQLLKCYHGGVSRFDSFTSPINWFSPYREYTQQFSLGTDVEYQVYLNAKNLCFVGDTSGLAFNLYPIRPPYKFSPKMQKILEVANITEEELYNAFEDVEDKNLHSFNANRLRIHQIVREKAFKDLLVARGFDGIHAIEDKYDTYGIFYPEDIKSIDNRDPQLTSNIHN